MKCDEASEYVSALYDGDLIPPPAAEHIGSCAACKVRIGEYAQMGAELRKVACLETLTTAPRRQWTGERNAFAAFWQKGWENMRIPRLAFVMLIVCIVALGSTLAMVRVRAHNSGVVVLLTVTTGENKPSECALSTVDKRDSSCGFLGDVEHNMLVYTIDLLKRDGDRVQLGIRTKVLPPKTPYTTNDLATEPQQLFWFEPGSTLLVEVPVISPIIIKGNWLDHMPAFTGTHDMDPGPEELRIVSPLLLRGNDVVGDMEGASVMLDKQNWAAWVYYPGQGSYLISLVRMQGGIEAKAELNRISFQEAGSSCVLITGTPISRARRVWVLHKPDFDPNNSSQNGKYGFTASLMLNQAASGEWVPANPTN
jgi:hypothetical protein